MKTLPSFTAQQSLFRAYDIRGECQYFTNDFIAALGEVFANLYQSQSYYEPASKSAIDKNLITVVIGFDVRLGSNIIAKTLVDILQAKGLAVVNLGLVTTPMMAFWAQQYNGHGIMVTASHSAKDILGIKWLVDNSSPSSLEIQTLYQQLSHNCFKTLNDSEQNNVVNLPAQIIASTYIDAIAQSFMDIGVSKYQQNLAKNKLDITVVIDCMNGATSTIAQAVFERFCQRVIMLNDSPDGTFPIGNPDPTEPNRLAELQQAVIASQADMGLAFDGDGDRLMVVDNIGQVIVADHLLYLLAQVAITEQPVKPSDLEIAPKVLFDVKCSHHLPILLSNLGATPIMTRTGSSLLRQQLQSLEQPPIFAGELSGHFMFNDGFFMTYDDAMYAGLRLLHWLAFTAPRLESAIFQPKLSNTDDRLNKNQFTLSQVTQSLPMTVSSSDHYLPLSKTFLAQNNADSCTFIEHLIEYCRYLQHLVEDSTAHNLSMQKSIFARSISCTCFSAAPPMLKTKFEAEQLLPLGTRLSCIDGLRLDFAHGFGIVRRSNTSSSLTVRFSGDTINELQKIRARFVALCRLFDNELAEQMALIKAE